MRQKLTPAESDALTGWRRFFNWRPGQRKAAKRSANKRSRREGKAEARDYDRDDPTHTQSFRAAFRFGRQLADPELRERLRRLGFDSGETRTVVTTRDEPMPAVLRRLVLHEIAMPCLLAVAADSQPHGFALVAMHELPVAGDGETVAQWLDRTDGGT